MCTYILLYLRTERNGSVRLGLLYLQILKKVKMI